MNRMEVPKDYNTADNFYNRRLLKTFGANQNSDLIFADQYDSATPSDVVVRAKHLAHINNDAIIDEESLEDTSSCFRNKSKNKNMDNTDSSIHASKKSSTGNKENIKNSAMFSHSDSDNSQNKDEANQIQIRSHNRGISSIDRGKELLTITVEISSGQKENVIIFENDDGYEISEAFCK